MKTSPGKILVLLLALLAIALGCEPGSNGAQPWNQPSSRPLPLSTRGRWIVDDQGRTVILRGVNYNGIESMLFTDQPPLLSDFQQIRRWGFNVIRFPISWNFIEPARGVIDETYLDQWVLPVLDFAAQEHIGVILDLHQWNWSPCFNPNGTGQGAPKWALPLWAQELCPGNYAYGDAGEPDAFQQMLRASADFWLDVQAREDLFRIWEFTVKRYKDHPAVIGYDIFNEPTPGDIWSAHPAEFDLDILMPFYEEMIRRIRAVDPDKLIFYECSIMHDVYDNFFTPLPFKNIVYSSHLYTGGTSGGTIGYPGNPGPLSADVQKSMGEAARQGVPLWVGELGIGVAALNSALWMRDEYVFQEQARLGSAWWSMRQHDNDTFGLTNFDTRAEKRGLLDYVSRAYPAATPGELLAFRFDERTKTFSMTFANRPHVTGETLIAVPEYQYANGIQVECSDADGRWSYAYDPAAGFLQVRVDPDTSVHTIRVLPKY